MTAVADRPDGRPVKSRGPGTLTCPACETIFLADPVFYTACNCSVPATLCPHEGVALAVYETRCPAGNCGAEVEDHEDLRDLVQESREGHPWR